MNVDAILHLFNYQFFKRMFKTIRYKQIEFRQIECSEMMKNNATSK